MKINNIIIDECVSNEIKWLVKNNEDGYEYYKDRWFSWSNVFEGVMGFEFEKGFYSIGLSMERMGYVKKEEDMDEDWFKSVEEDFGERFYEDDKLVLVNFEDGVYVWVK